MLDGQGEALRSIGPCGGVGGANHSTRARGRGSRSRIHSYMHFLTNCQELHDIVCTIGRSATAAGTKRGRGPNAGTRRLACLCACGGGDHVNALPGRLVDICAASSPTSGGRTRRSRKGEDPTASNHRALLVRTDRRADNRRPSATRGPQSERGLGRPHLFMPGLIRTFLDIPKIHCQWVWCGRAGGATVAAVVFDRQKVRTQTRRRAVTCVV